MAYIPLDIEALQSALATAPVGHRILYMREVTSTMDVARQEALLRGAEEGLVVVAEEQTAGRGRFGRAWVSTPGQNLYFSVVLYPSPWACARLSVAASVAVVRAIRRVTGLEPSLKWPNDVRLGDKKVSGILVETAVQDGQVRHAIVGIGINVNADPSERLAEGYQATCLARELGLPVSRDVVLEAVLLELAGSASLVPRLRRKVRAYVHPLVASTADAANGGLQALAQRYSRLPERYLPDLEHAARALRDGRWGLR